MTFESSRESLRSAAVAAATVCGVQQYRKSSRILRPHSSDFVFIFRFNELPLASQSSSMAVFLIPAVSSPFVAPKPLLSFRRQPSISFLHLRLNNNGIPFIHDSPPTEKKTRKDIYPFRCMVLYFLKSVLMTTIPSIHRAPFPPNPFIQYLGSSPVKIVTSLSLA